MIKGDLGLDDDEDAIESHPCLASQNTENCRDRSVRWCNWGLPDMAEKTPATVSSSFMTTVCTSQGQMRPPTIKG